MRLKGALPAEQPGKGIWNGEGLSAGKSHKSPQPAHLTKNRDKGARGTRSIPEGPTHDTVPGTRTRSFQGPGDPQGRAVPCWTPAQPLLHFTSFSLKPPWQPGPGRCGCAVTQAGQPTKPGWADKAELSLLWLRSQQPAVGPKS